MYMSPGETSLYFMYNSWWTMQLYPYALVHTTLFFPIYLFELFIEGKGADYGLISL